MRIVTLPMLDGDQSVQDALTFIHAPGESVLATYRDEVRLIKCSQLLRVESSQRLGRRLRDLPLESSTAVALPSKIELGKFKIKTAGPLLPGEAQGLLTSLGRRLVLVSRATTNYLISASEDFLVDYYCDPDKHPYSPPPAWHEGMRCFCGLPIRRDG